MRLSACQHAFFFLQVLTHKSMSYVRILLVDDSIAFLESATRFLSVDARLEIVGRAFSGGEALEQVSRLYPDLVLMDLAMPGMNGLEATHLVKAQPNAPHVVILTLNDSSEYRAAALNVGADGFVTKSEFGTALLPLIQSLFTELCLRPQEGESDDYSSSSFKQIGAYHW